MSEAQPPDSAQVIDIVATLARLTLEGSSICDTGALIRALVGLVSGTLFDIGSFLTPVLHSEQRSTGQVSLKSLINRTDMESTRRL